MDTEGQQMGNKVLVDGLTYFPQTPSLTSGIAEDGVCLDCNGRHPEGYCPKVRPFVPSRPLTFDEIKGSAMSRAELMRRFECVPQQGGAEASSHAHIRIACRTLMLLLDEECPDGREKAVAMTKLDEVMMWAKAAVDRPPIQNVEKL